MLKFSDKAPEFTLKTDEGHTVQLKDYRGRTVILYFYPKDDTPGCTKEACDFRDHWTEFTKQKAVVLGVSHDDMASHQRFKERHQLPFPLLIDEDKRISKAYGVYKQKSLYGRTFWGIERTTFVIDPLGKIQAIFPRVQVNGHVQEVLNQIGGRVTVVEKAAGRV
ncbi:MAG: thioredoxin-dependent thiol peroxidase [Elusimicrobia bacterium]|nr:thioredoxin-dependent thiol peroxidase [Elusimicrobiota bacterium]